MGCDIRINHIFIVMKITENGLLFCNFMVNYIYNQPIMIRLPVSNFLKEGMIMTKLGGYPFVTLEKLEGQLREYFSRLPDVGELSETDRDAIVTKFIQRCSLDTLECFGHFGVFDVLQNSKVSIRYSLSDGILDVITDGVLCA